MTCFGARAVARVVPEAVVRAMTGTGMFVEMVRIINEQGIPQRQSNFVELIIDWFHHASENGDIPDESTIRKRVLPVWRRLNELE